MFLPPNNSTTGWQPSLQYMRLQGTLQIQTITVLYRGLSPVVFHNSSLYYPLLFSGLIYHLCTEWCKW
jgi:hypothetical protein